MSEINQKDNKTITSESSDLQALKCKVRPDILSYDDICDAVPFFKKRPKLTHRLMHWLYIDKCNQLHESQCYQTGAPFAASLIRELGVKEVVYNEQVLEQFKDCPFITVSNHPMGSLDGIMLIDIIGRHRPDFKVMVNMILYQIQAMRPNFIPVDPLSSDDPEKKNITLKGIREAIGHVQDGHPLGFFPAGAVSKIDKTLHISDRAWQPSIIRLIKQFKLPVIPVYFNEHNSTFFNILGMMDWRLRTLRLPRELFNKDGRKLHVVIGDPISPETLKEYGNLDELGKFLRHATYALKDKMR